MNKKIIINKNETLKIISKAKKIYFFGSGVIAEKTISNLNLYNKLNGIFDNSKTLWNTKIDNAKIINPKQIKNLKRDEFIILITTTSFKNVYYELENEFNLKPGVDFYLSFMLQDQVLIEDIQSLKKKILFTSGAPKNNNARYGGGLYEVNLNGNSWKLKKVYNGNCYGLIEVDSHIYLVDTDKGIIKMNKNFKIISNYKIEKGLRAHGLSYCNKSKKFVIASSYKDKIVIFNKKFKKLKEIELTKKIKYESSPQHHCNDCEIINNNVYVSMFSISGNWKKEVFDGGILEINLKDNNKQTLINNLWMPHNVKYINGSLHILDSLRGGLLFNNFTLQGTFPAFTRGLNYDNGYYYIGQSRNRNFSRFIGVSNNISVDTGIIIFNPELKISRFLQFSNSISEIHSVLLI